MSSILIRKYWGAITAPHFAISLYSSDGITLQYLGITQGLFLIISLPVRVLEYNLI